MAEDIITQIVRNPAQFGCVWVDRELSRGAGVKKVSLGKRPLLEVADLAKFRATVPDADANIRATLNGTSFPVRQQAALRPAIARNATVKAEELKVLCVKRVLGVRLEATAAPVEQTFSRKDWANTPKPIQDSILASGVKVVFTE